MAKFKDLEQKHINKTNLMVVLQILKCNKDILSKLKAA